MDKIYEFNGKKYRLRELDLNLMHKVSHLLIKYRELYYKYTCNIDTTKLDEVEFEVEQLKLAINELKESDNPCAEDISKLEFNLKEAESFLSSPTLISLRKYLNDTEALALFEIITDAEFMSVILNGILTSIDEKVKTEIKTEELQNKDAIKFIKEVIGDFFLLMKMHS